MRTENFNGILLSILITVSMIAPVITVSLLSVSPVSASPGPYENVIRAREPAYNANGDAMPFWKFYGPGKPEQRPPLMAAKKIDSGAVVAAGFAATARNGRWNSISNPYPNLDVLLDNAFRWMTGLEPNQMDVLWYGEEDMDYNVYNDAAACSALISALRDKGYTVDNTLDDPDEFDNITPGLLAPYEIFVLPQMELGASGTGGDPDELPQSVVDTIESYVRGGGGLLIMDGYDKFGYNYCWVQDKILRPLDMGIYFQSDSVYDEVNYYASTWEIIADVDSNTWIGSAYENATGTTGIGLYCPTSLAERRNYEISVGIFPEFKNAFPNTTVEYSITVLAAGWERDNISLSVASTWTATLDDNEFEDVGLEGRKPTLTVTIPSDAAFGAEDEITITATSDGDETLSQVVTSKAISSMRIGPPVEDVYTTQWMQEWQTYLGNYIWMQVGSDKDNNKRIYMKFDLSGIPEGLIPPDNVQIDDIQARLYAYCEVLPTYATAGKNVSIYEVNNDDWHENEMWWGDNEPGIGALLDTTPITEEGLWYSWDVTQHVIDEYKNDNIASFSLRAPTENLKGIEAFEYYSFVTSNASETWQHPYLIIGYDVSTWISPDYDGIPGGTLTYDINVWNRGSFADNYTLDLDNVWETTLSNNTIVNLGPMETKTETLTVKIPGIAPIGLQDNIIITAVSEHSGENDIGTCIARASTHVSAWEDSSTRGRDDPPSNLENFVWGRATGIYVGRYNDGPERGWLKFDLDAFAPGTTVTRANLYLNSYSTYGANVVAYGVGDDSWSEYTINWLNKPSIAEDNALDTRAVIENDKWYSWDVTDFVASEYAGDKVVSFCLVDIGENIAPNHDARFSSKEYTDNWAYLEILATDPDTDVRAIADPIFQGGLGGDTLTYNITVVNKGDDADSFDLTLVETEAWGSSLSNDNLLNIASGDNSTTTLSVPIPGGATVCTTNDITISVISRENSEIYDNIRCSAHRSKATMSLKRLYDVKLDLNALLRDDASDLVLEFRNYGDGYEGENVLWSTMPAHLEYVKDIRHSQGQVTMRKTKLILKDADGNTIQTLSTFTVYKVDLEIRFAKIPLEWLLAQTQQEKTDLEMEFARIPLAWLFAPT